jgi:hypothetical protein
MKTIAESEPRIPIHLSELPKTIVNPGSYYLAEDAQTATASITIAANFVSIDLAGFTIGLPDSPSPIVALSAVHHVAVRNGFVVGAFGAIDLESAADVLLEGVQVSGWGSKVGDRSNVSHCQFRSASGGIGFVCGDECIVTDSQFVIDAGSGIVNLGSRALLERAVIRNGDGVSLGYGSIVSHSVIFGDDLAITGSASVSVLESSIRSSGDSVIQLGDDARIVNSHVEGGHTEGINLGAHSQVYSLHMTAQSRGLFVGNGSVVRDSVLSASSPALLLGSDSTAAGNTCTGATVGISVRGGGNRIEGNSLIRNNIGLQVGGTGNSIHQNSATQNPGGNYQIVAGNDVGPIGPSATATSPWANISY